MYARADRLKIEVDEIKLYHQCLMLRLQLFPQSHLVMDPPLHQTLREIPNEFSVHYWPITWRNGQLCKTSTARLLGNSGCRLGLQTFGIGSLTLSPSQWINRALLLSTYNFISPMAKTFCFLLGLSANACVNSANSVSDRLKSRLLVWRAQVCLEQSGFLVLRVSCDMEGG